MKELYAIVVLIAASVCLVTSNDDSSCGIKRPCGTNIDLDCVKKYLSENSDCRTVHGDNRPSGRYNLIQTLYAPLNDVTLLRKNLYPSCMDGYVEEFFIDESKDSLVLSFNIGNITSFSPDTYYVYDQPKSESLVVLDSVGYTIRAVFTAVVQTSDGITPEALKRALYSVYYSVGDCTIHLGDKTSCSDEPRVQEALVALSKNYETIIVEGLLSMGSYYYLEFLQHHICDFSLQPTASNKFNFRDVSVPIKNIGDNDNAQDCHEPCKGSKDLRKCAADYFSNHDHCTLVDCPDNEPVTREALAIYMPMFNISVITLRAEISGLNGNIKKLYYNKKTKNIVFAIHFDKITLDSPETPLTLYQRSAQPKYFTDSVKDYYGDVTLTAMIPVNKGLTAEAIKNAYVSSQIGSVIINTGNRYGYSDPQIISIFDSLEDESNALACGKEIFLTEGYSMFLAYLQKYICDYDIPLGDSQHCNI